jgi:predicted Zn-dependent peptidase
MSVQVTRLENGLRVLTDTMDTVETVSLGVWVDVGTRHEPKELNGVAHMLEHMAFKGTLRRSALDIAAAIEDVGGHLNAYTAREHTAYYAKVLKQDLGLVVDILGDILQHSAFDPAEFERERGVILQEIGQAQDTPEDLIFDLLQETAYPDQPMGRPVLGRAETIRGIGRDSVAGYLGRTYAAPGMVLAAAGNCAHADVVALAARHFGSMPQKSAASTAPARYAGGEHREIRPLEQVHLALGFPGFAYADPDFYAAAVVSAALGGGMSSRLFQEIREKRGLVYSIYTFTHPYSDGGVFGVYAGTGEKEAAELVPVLCKEFRKLERGFAPAELDRARAQLKASLLMALEATSARAEQHANHMLVFGTPFEVSEAVARIENVDGAAVARVAKRLQSANPTFAAIGPVGAVEDFSRIAARLAA